MTWKIVGPSCKEQDCNRPVFLSGWCRRHWDLASAFGYRGEEPEIVVLDHRSFEFSRELNEWRKEAA